MGVTMSRGEKQVSGRRKLPFGGNLLERIRAGPFSNRRNQISGSTDDISPELVRKYLAEHPLFLESIVKEQTPKKNLLRVQGDGLGRKKSRTLGALEASHTFLSLKTKYTGLCLKSQTQLCLSEGRKKDVSEILDEAACILAKATDSDDFALYLPKHNETELEHYYNGTKKPYGPIGKGMTVAALAAMEKTIQLVENLPQDTRFPKGVGRGATSVHSALCVPLVLPSNDLLGVIELTKEGLKDSFTDEDHQLANAMLSWLVASLHQCRMNRVLLTQSKLNDFLLDTTKVLFDEMISIDTLVQNIMYHTKDLVQADRSALFLVDEEKNELFANYFDEGVTEDGKPVFTKRQIRFPSDRGIAGHVAKTGEALNIPDAYEDPRFNRDVDKQTGYTTKNILCMPIISRGKVIGVVQMVNSLTEDHFTKADEEAFKMFAVYCALALHYSKLFSLLKQQQDQYKVAMDVLEFHFVAHDEEVDELADNPYPAAEEVPAVLSKYEFFADDFEKQLPKLFLHMIDDLFGQNMFDQKKLCQFILTVRKNYRPLLYHNWRHGFEVAHALYCMIKTNPGIFSIKEQMGLVISGLCHDVDHRGYNNAFFTKLQLPMAALYSTSVMEQHHYKQTVMILQSEAHDIFSFMTADEYKEMLEMIRQAIIATDLALYFPNQKSLAALIKENTFDINNTKMRGQCKSLMMTGADLCAVAKPWRTQEQTVDHIYEEFYVQGDKEKKYGFQPIPMMDREYKDEMPKQQVGFIGFICLPLYNTLIKILPGSQPLLDGTNSNTVSWKALVEAKEKQKQLATEEEGAA
ncbi:cAMP and cAMP-inhibited cGMP 3',5'-cyclic phosphodiesterase 10A-like [Haliotis rufescens]|uniref:cAMP and cAMP-inhibited cGMP 3',5'-cyclic phosphodiesterase 10A-like n=1 Tax=Haliotis rufescens TaxID=6454 RepID=UPI00201F33FB|nr:cAMP and cAMP-inhibited cGMP 3',5'-cyclic phosphodiesterase 10A-like [Haliotis rufescens]